MAKKIYRVAAKTGLNLRAKPSKTADVIRVLLPGARVEVSGEAPEGWAAVKGGGYVMSEFIK